jgi:hypothetical protein
VLKNDYTILSRMLEQMKFEAERRYKEKKIPIEVSKWFINLDQKTEETFVDAMKLNLKEFNTGSQKGVCGLLSYYIELGMDKKSLEENDMLDFGSFYEQRERAYGLG